VNPVLVDLYRRAAICKAFPAYRLDELDVVTMREPLWAMQLLDAVQKIKA
jgi:hypothetical protein